MAQLPAIAALFYRVLLVDEGELPTMRPRVHHQQQSLPRRLLLGSLCGACPEGKYPATDSQTISATSASS
jgi:hypothetical protein